MGAMNFDHLILAYNAGEACLTETYIETKVYKSKPTLKPMPNRKIVALHKYLFYGWASC